MSLTHGLKAYFHSIGHRDLVARLCLRCPTTGISRYSNLYNLRRLYSGRLIFGLGAAQILVD